MGPRVDGAPVGAIYDSGNNASSANATVQVGENSLGQVAKRLGVDADELLMANPQIKDPWKLQAGQEIHLPVGYQPPAPSLLNNPTAVRQAFSSPAAGTVDAKGMAEMKLREATMHSLIEQAAKAGFSQPEMIRMINTMVPLTSSEFNKWSAKMQSAFHAGDKIGALRTIGLAQAAHDIVAKSGGGQAIQADVVTKQDGIHFDFDRPVSQQQAADLIFQGGKVPEGAKLVQGAGNSWVVQRPNDLDSQQEVTSHFRQHLETVDNMRRGSTFTWVMNPAHALPPVSHRKDLDNDFGFKIRKNFPLDQGDIRAEQLRSMIGKGFGYELQFDKPMTKDEVMDKLFTPGAKFNKADVKLVAVPKEPSDVYQVKIVGPDALTAIKGKYVPAFADSVIYNKASLPPELPAGLRGQFENHTIPPGAKKISPDTYMWEKDGYIAYVKSDGKNYYDPQATKMPNDPALKKTIQYFMEEKGLPPREAWKAFDKHWEELDRMMIMALMSFYSSMAGAIGERPNLDAEIGSMRGPKLGGRMEEGAGNEATTEVRGAKGTTGLEKTEQETGLAKVEQTEVGASAKGKAATKGEEEVGIGKTQTKGTEKKTNVREEEEIQGNQKTKVAAGGKGKKGKVETDEQRIRQIDDWNKKGKFPGDPKRLKERLREGDPKAVEEYEGIKTSIQESKRPGQGEPRAAEAGARVQRMSDANKVELENSGWLKEKLPDPTHRKEFMKWLEENHQQGEAHIHLRPGSREAEDALQDFKLTNIPRY
ncbi:MAG TPA: LysM peptidoglycan-binding domain-containing protein, partial [Terriglobales bacterium]|nr:LysM peptidoglycan-binding domain-containing protein [Terriglobales bacterium]